jgi:formiminoglutamase
MKLIKIPFESGALAKKQGLSSGPDRISAELKNFYLKESGILPFFDIEALKIDNANMEDSHNNIYTHIKNLVVPAILVGGDHSLTYSAFKGFSKNSKNPGLVVFDAHLDCENDFTPPTHEDYLRALIKESYLKPENTLVIGVRNFHSNELEFAKKHRIKIYDMKEISSESKAEVADAIMSVARNFDALYVSVDIDVLDPAFAPGTGYTEPGGMTTRELLYFIHRLKNLKNIKVWDLVEVNPQKDINNLTIMAAAKLLVEMS